MKKNIFGDSGIQDIYTVRIKISKDEFFKYRDHPKQTLYKILHDDERIFWRRVWCGFNPNTYTEIRVVFKCKRKDAKDAVKKFQNSIFPVPLKSVLFL